ncbi:MAG TPA: hypothetical protein VGV90_15885 [Solirubrobacteraceae bacterium]|nr:hypothetical protein [Solirubrobacteraceae bacterium]
MTRALRLTLTVVAAALALAGLTAGYVKWELAEPEAFADRGVNALQSEAARAAIAEQIVVAALERRSPDLVATRPLVLAAVEALLETDEFARVLRRAAVTAHGVLLRGERDVRVELREVREVLIPALETASPRLARQVPHDLSPQIAEIRANDVAASVVRFAESASVAAIPLLIAALLALIAAVATAPDRRGAGAEAGMALAIAMGLGLLALAALRGQMLSHTDAVGVLSQDETRAAASAAWDALAGDLQRWLVIWAIGGLAVVAGAQLSEAGLDRRAAMRRATEMVVGGRLSGPARIARGVGLTAIGAMVLLEVDPVFEIVVAALGAVLVLLGIVEAVSVGATARRSAGAGLRRPGRRTVIAAGAVGLGLAAVGLTLLLDDDAAAPLQQTEITACNGLVELCDRRLDQVVLAGTHNSMSAADRPGWLFANQTRPIPRQLTDGVRLMMIDPHYGIVDRQGRIRTDLEAEGTTRNRVAGRLGLDAVAAAERLAGRLDLVPADGKRKVYLCHTLCELGAERMSSTLREIRGWLERNRAEVLVILLESSVEPPEIEKEFESAKLEPYLATLPRNRPLPTLRQMIVSGRRLVVLDDKDGGDAPWHQPAFVFAQDTSISAFTKSRTACDPNRGTPESPLLIMNHWVDRFPPPPTAAEQVNLRSVLSQRIRACRSRLGRVPTAIAVDFYDRGDTIAVARELNQAGDAARREPR